MRYTADGIGKENVNQSWGPRSDEFRLQLTCEIEACFHGLSALLINSVKNGASRNPACANRWRMIGRARGAYSSLSSPDSGSGYTYSLVSASDSFGHSAGVPLSHRRFFLIGNSSSNRTSWRVGRQVETAVGIHGSQIQS